MSDPDFPGLEPVPPRPDQYWGEPLPPRRRRGVVAVVASLVVVALLGSTLVGGVAVRDLIRPRGNSSEYAFLATFGGEPVRWNPCEPIHYVVNIEGAPDGALDDVHTAVTMISRATGVVFSYDGLTDEVPQKNRGPYQPSLYGERWAPVVIAWVSQDETTIPLEDDGEFFSGVARPLSPPGDRSIFVSGWIVMNESDPNPTGFAHPAHVGPTLVHELGHVMGLDHVESRAQIMEPSGGAVVELGPGDREGLRLLGRSQGCLDAPDPG